MDTHKTTVIFRKFKDGEVIALFPYIIEKHNGEIMSYMHIGQHSAADYNYIVSRTKLCTEKEYKDLKNELTNIGYNLTIRKKRNYGKYLESFLNTK